MTAPVTNASAVMTASLPPSTPSGKAILYTQVKMSDGTDSNILVKGTPQETMTRVNTAMKGVNTYVRDVKGAGVADARKVTIRLTDQTVTWIKDGKLTTLEITKIKETALRTLLLDLCKDEAPRSTTDPSSPSNRPVGCSKPLEVNTAAWHKATRISATQFVYNGSYSALDKYMKDAEEKGELPNGIEIANNALPKIKAASELIENFRQELRKALKEKENELRPENTPINELEKKRDLKEEIQKLRNLIAQLDQEQLDGKAIFWDAALAPDDLQGFHETSHQTDAEEQTQMTRAEFAGKSMRTHLFTTLKHPNNAFVKAYGNDEKGLMFQNRWKYKGITDAEGAEERGRSVEQFIVSNVLNLKTNDDEYIPEAMKSLGLSCQGVGKTIALALSMARHNTRAAYDMNTAAMVGAVSSDAQVQHLFPHPLLSH